MPRLAASAVPADSAISAISATLATPKISTYSSDATQFPAQPLKIRWSGKTLAQIELIGTLVDHFR